MKRSRGGPVSRWITALGTGLRQEELLALRWDDVDLEQRRLRVRHTLGRVEGKLVLLVAATFLLGQGFGLEDVKYQLGHSSIVLTSNTYGHVLERRQREVARGMDAVPG